MELEKDTRLDQQGPDTFVTFQETDILGIRSFCRLPKTRGVAVTGKTCRSFASHTFLLKTSRETQKNHPVWYNFSQTSSWETKKYFNTNKFLTGWCNSNIFSIHPDPWGNGIQFDVHIFNMGWFNHQEFFRCYGKPRGSPHHELLSIKVEGLDEGHWSCQCSRTTPGILHCSGEA